MYRLACLLMIVSMGAWGADYYVRADGTAANKAAATAASAASTAMNVTVFNAETFSASDTVWFSGLGGEYTSTITLPSDSVTYSGIDGDRPIMRMPNSTTGIDVNGKAATLTGFTILEPDFRAGVLITDSGSSAEVTTVTDIIIDATLSTNNGSTYSGVQVDDTTQQVILEDIRVTNHRFRNNKCGSLPQYGLFQPDNRHDQHLSVWFLSRRAECG